MTKLYDADFSGQQDDHYIANGSGGTTLTNSSLGLQKEVTIRFDFEAADGFVGGELLSMGFLSISINEAGKAVFHTPNGDVASEQSALDGAMHQVELIYDTNRGFMRASLDSVEAGSTSASAPVAASSMQIGKGFAGWIDNVWVAGSGEIVAATATLPSVPTPAALPTAPPAAPAAAPPADPAPIAERPVAAPVVAGDGTVVGSSDALNAALARASGGETFLLQAGVSYDIDVRSWSAHSAPVTVTSADHGQLAHVTGIDIQNAHGLVIDHVRVQSPTTNVNDPDIRVVDSSDVTIRNSQMVGEAQGYATSRWADDMLEAYNVDGLTFVNNEVSNYFHGLGIHQSSDVVVRGNDLHTIQGDGMRFSADHGVAIENNWFHDFLGSDGNINHNDYVQFWTAGTNTPSTDIAIRGNMMANTSGTESQAIFMADEANNGTRFQNVLIEGNFIENNHLHGVTVNRADGVVVRDNSMPVMPGGQWGMLSKINVIDSTAAQIYDNLTNGVDPLRTNVARNDGNSGPANLTAVIVGEESGTRSFSFDGRFSVNKSGFVGNNARFNWDFGDGTTATGRQVAKTYADAADHQVVLTVLHNDGSSDTATLVASHQATTVQAPDDSGSLSFLHHADLWN